jgi:diguanylate cyclase (GGDEF)-like protein
VTQSHGAPEGLAEPPGAFTVVRDRKGRVPAMKPAWHEVVASLETSLARGSQGSHATNGGNVGNGGTGASRLSTGALVIPRGLPVTWHDPVTDRAEPAPPPVTAPPGRAELLASLERRMNREEEGIAVALVDLDGFKSLNHAHGHAAGDQALAATLSRLQGAVGSGLVARFGSDEFAVLLGGVETTAALGIADRLVAAVAEPLSLGGTTVRLGSSVGIACRTGSHARPEDLIRDADRALSRARTLGGNRSAVHDPATSGRPLALAELEVALRRALDTDEFREHYQPIVSVKGGQVAGFEVHLWRRSAVGRRR